MAEGASRSSACIHPHEESRTCPACPLAACMLYVQEKSLCSRLGLCCWQCCSLELASGSRGLIDTKGRLPLACSLHKTRANTLEHIDVFGQRLSLSEALHSSVWTMIFFFFFLKQWEESGHCKNRRRCRI